MTYMCGRARVCASKCYGRVFARASALCNRVRVKHARTREVDPIRQLDEFSRISMLKLTDQARSQ
jgi:hypothetical protein